MIRRAIFIICNSLVEQNLLKWVYIYWNRFLLNLLGAKVGRNCKMHNRVYFTVSKDKHNFCIGDNVKITSGSYNPIARGMKSHIYIGPNASLHIGNNVGISSSVIWSAQKVIIGNNVIVGALTTIMDTDAHPIEYIERLHNPVGGNKAPIYIGDNVFIGAQCIILKGVTIGNRSVIAAGSVVTKSIPEDCIAGGNPAKIIRYFNQK